MLAVVFAFSAVIAVPASAKLTKHQKQHIRKQLRKQIKKHPRMIKNKRWLKKASLVDFKLPVTIKLRTQCVTANGTQTGATPGTAGSQCANNGVNTGTGLNETGTNTASIDLGPSLGQRTIQLGGKLKAQITFSDSFDGGALGNVKLDLLPGDGLTSSSIPLLWNPDVSGSTRGDVNFANAVSHVGAVAFNNSAITGATQGCGDFVGSGSPGNTLATASPTVGTGVPSAGYNALFYGSGAADGFTTTPASALATLFASGAGMPGYPFVSAGGVPSGFLPIYPGIDDWNNIKTGTKVGDNDWIGPNDSPFPGAAYPPGAATNNALTRCCAPTR